MPSKDWAYEPRIWVVARNLPQERYEPLILSWDGNNHTVYVPDPGFLMTYGLIPRPLADGDQVWDDLRLPMRGVVRVSRPSVYDFPAHSPASVTIDRRYLQDYLSLRDMALVQVVWEQRPQPLTEDVAARLGDKEAVEFKFSDRTVQVNRRYGETKTVTVQVWVGRVIGRPGPFPVSKNILEVQGLTWPGFDGPVTDARAMRMSPADFVYISDSVLAEFEGRDEYRVNPDHGIVSLGVQWSVSHTERIDRDLLRVELKKLYEGVPDHVTEHWNKFAVQPPANPYADLLDRPNIAKRASAIILGLVGLGEALADLAEVIGVSGQTSETLVGLDRAKLKYYGLWKESLAERIARHVPLAQPQDAFLSRCLALSKLVIEQMDERALRSMLHAVGVPNSEISGHKALKLLDRLVRLCQITALSGLSFRTDSAELLKRLSEENRDDVPNPLECSFALNDLRQVAAHAVVDNARLRAALKRFGISPGETAPGYGAALDRIYDALIGELGRVANMIRSGIRS
jgi:hypothetical protein